MNFYFIPLEEHPDYGYGMIGSIYNSSANDLSNNENFREDWYSVLPVNFLYRHCIELFMKSGIILFHKKFSINFDNETCDGEPKVKLQDGSWKLLKTTHNIYDLYKHLNFLIESKMEYLQKNTNTKWDFNIDFEKWINKINGYDSVSDYFRCPITKDKNKDKNKSIFQENTIDGIHDEIQHGKRIMALIVEDSNGNAKNIYTNNSTKMIELYKVLKDVSGELGGFHMAVRMELFNGF